MNEHLLVSRNKREGWYAGWRPQILAERHRRTGKPYPDADWFPHTDPLDKRRLKRFREPIDVQIL